MLQGPPKTEAWPHRRGRSEVVVTYPTTLTQDQIEFLKRYGQTRDTKAGQVLFRAGGVSNDFIVVLEG
jgi:CRP-like cAMP-binding protein